MLVGERSQFMHQPFRADPTQRMSADVELPGIVTQHDGVAQKFVCLNAAPQSTLGGDPDRLSKTFNALKPNRSRCACQAVWSLNRVSGPAFQTGDRSCWQALVSHVVVSCIVEHVVGVSACSRSRKFSRL